MKCSHCYFDGYVDTNLQHAIRLYQSPNYCSLIESEKLLCRNYNLNSLTLTLNNPKHQDNIFISTLCDSNVLKVISSLMVNGST